MQRCSLSLTGPDDIGDDDGGVGLDANARTAEHERGQTDLKGLTIDNRRILLRLDERTKDLERMIRDLRSAGRQQMARRSAPADRLASREFYGEREDGVGDDDDLEDSVQELLSNILGTSLLYVTGMNIHDHTVFVDPVGSGLITSSSMDVLLDRYEI